MQAKRWLQEARCDSTLALKMLQPRLPVAFVAGLLAAAGVAPALAAADAACLETMSTATVREVVDSRSLLLADGRTIRLAGIEPFGLLTSDPERMDAELHSRLIELIGSQEINIQIVGAEADRYGRQPAIVAVEGRLLQETVAGEGLALAFAGATLPCFDRILAAEIAARENHHGFWTGDLPAARPEALASWIGRFVIFEGKVISVGNRRARTYLNFGYRWSEDVTAEIAADDRELFGGEAVLEALVGEKVRVRGFLEEKGGPMVVLRSPTQLEVLAHDVGNSGKAP